jgi:hypothetical protein
LSPPATSASIKTLELRIAGGTAHGAKGSPGTSDTIAITAWNKQGGLWFASNWNGTKTIEQLFGGGDLSVH